MSTATAPVPPSVKKWMFITAIIGYASLLVYLFYFVGFFALLDALSKVNVWIYLLAIASILVSITLHALVWFKLLNFLDIKLSFRRTYVFYWMGVFVDNLIPGGWSGDLFKAYVLGRDPDIESGKAVASVVAKNMYEAIFNLANMVLGLILLVLNYTLEGAIFLGIGSIMFLLTLPLIILLVISFRPAGTKKAINLLIHGLFRLSRRRINLLQFEPKIDKVLDDYHDGMRILLDNPKMLKKPMIISFFAWGLEVLTLYLVFASLGYFVEADKVVIVRSIAGNVEAQGYAFAGYAQIITTALYTALGVLPGVAASVGLLGGVVIFWLKTVISYIAFYCVIFTSCANFICIAIRGTPPRCNNSTPSNKEPPPQNPPKQQAN